MQRRRFTIAIAILLAATATLCVGAARPASAAAAGGPATPIDIVKVSGLIDPINADLVARSVGAAEAHHALVLVIQLNSTGGTISASAREALALKIVHSPIPVAVWVGGSGR